jgi:hypothetical protein
MQCYQFVDLWSTLFGGRLFSGRRWSTIKWIVWRFSDSGIEQLSKPLTSPCESSSLTKLWASQNHLSLISDSSMFSTSRTGFQFSMPFPKSGIFLSNVQPKSAFDAWDKIQKISHRLFTRTGNRSTSLRFMCLFRMAQIITDPHI